MLDDVPSAGKTKPAVLTSVNPEKSTDLPATDLPKTEYICANAIVRAVSAGDLDYPVADVFGRCVLRLCLRADQFALWRRRKYARPVFQIESVLGEQASHPSEASR